MVKVYIPGRDTNKYPEEYRKGGNARFFTWDLNSFEAPAAGMVCLAAAALAAVAAAGPAAPQSNSETPCINNKLIRSVVLGAGRPGARCAKFRA